LSELSTGDKVPNFSDKKTTIKLDFYKQKKMHQFLLKKQYC